MMVGSSRTLKAALSVAAFLGRSRKITLFAALDAGAGLVRELSDRASDAAETETSAEIPGST